MIILTREQANRVRGLTTSGHALVPIPLADGRFALPESVLADPEHARYHAGLAALPRVTDRSLSEADYEQDPVRYTRYDYRSNWRAGELVEVNDP